MNTKQIFLLTLLSLACLQQASAMEKCQKSVSEQLCEAIEKLDVEAVSQLLLSNRQSVNVNKEVHCYQMSPLSYAIYVASSELWKLEIEKSLKILNILLAERGADVNRKTNSNKISALYWAISYKNFKVLKVLLENDATVNKKLLELAEASLQKQSDSKIKLVDQQKAQQIVALLKKHL